jgi:hypothetical protein
MKQLARADVAVSEKAQGLAAGEKFPTHSYNKEATPLTVEFDPKNRTIRAARAYILDAGITVGNLPMGPFTAAHDRNVSIDKSMKAGADGWAEKGSPGVPALGPFLDAENMGRDLLNGTPDTPVQWPRVIPMLLLSQTEPNGEANINKVPKYFNDELPRILGDLKGRGGAIVNMGNLDQDLKIMIPRVTKGTHTVVIALTVGTASADRAFFVWIKDLEFGVQRKQGDKPVKDKDGDDIFDGPPKQVFTSSGEGANLRLDLDDAQP